MTVKTKKEVKPSASESAKKKKKSALEQYIGKEGYSMVKTYVDYTASDHEDNIAFSEAKKPSASNQKETGTATGDVTAMEPTKPEPQVSMPAHKKRTFVRNEYDFAFDKAIVLASKAP